MALTDGTTTQTDAVPTTAYVRRGGEEQLTVPVRLVAVEAFKGDLRRFFVDERSDSARPDAMAQLQRAFGPEARIPEEALGLRIPLATRSPRAKGVTPLQISCFRAIVTSLGDEEVGVLIEGPIPEQDELFETVNIGLASEPRKVEEATAEGCKVGDTPGIGDDELRQQMLRRVAWHLGNTARLARAMDDHPEAPVDAKRDLMVAAVARCLVKAMFRDTVWDVRFTDTIGLTAAIATVETADKSEQETLPNVADELVSVRKIPGVVHVSRCAVLNAEALGRRIALGRFSYWRFGRDWDLWDQPADLALQEMHGALRHLETAIMMAGDTRAELDALVALSHTKVTVTAGQASDESARASEDNARATTVLTAAVTGPLLVAAVLALGDYARAPLWWACAAALAAGGAMVAIAFALDRTSIKTIRKPAAMVAVVTVAALLLTRQVKPKDDPAPATGKVAPRSQMVRTCAVAGSTCPARTAR